jgi:murein DD-endopeptidase MepM/ murein hydrolase activator NlpD
MSYLIELNPALLKSTAPAGYSLRVPKSTATALIAGLDSIPADHRVAWRMHRVETGETLAAIAKRYGATPASIVSANHMLATDQPAPGDHLIIPSAYHEPAPKAVVRRTSARTRPRTVTPRTTASTVRPTAAKVAIATKPAPAKPVASNPVHKSVGTVAQMAKVQPKS